MQLQIFTFPLTIAHYRLVLSQEHKSSHNQEGLQCSEGEVDEEESINQGKRKQLPTADSDMKLSNILLILQLH